MIELHKKIGASLAATAFLLAGVPASTAFAQEDAPEEDSTQTSAIVESINEAVDMNTPVDMIGSSRTIEDGESEIVYNDGIGMAEGEILANAKKEYSDTASMDAFAKSLGGDCQYEVVASGRTFTLIRFKFSGVSVDDAVEKANASGYFTTASPNFSVKRTDEVEPSVSPAETSKYWDEEQLNWQGAWDIMPKKRAKVAVAVVDSGVEADNPDLEGRVLTGYNVLTNTTDTADLTGHGTQAASIISGKIGDDFGHDGGSYDADIYPVRVYGSADENSVVVSALANAIAHIVGAETNTSGVGKTLKQISEDSPAKKHNIRVANISFSSDVKYPDAQTLDEQYTQPLTVLEPIFAEALIDYNLATVVASGNEAEHFGGAYPAIPGDAPSTVNVISTNPAKQRSSFSNYNVKVADGSTQEYLKDIAAPGEDIAVANTGKQETVSNGTSFAAPQVSALLALMASCYPNASMEGLTNVIYGTAEDLGDAGTDLEYGHGLISPADAMSYLSVFSQLANAKVSIDDVAFTDFNYAKTEYDFTDTAKDAKHTVKFDLPEGWTASEPVTETTDVPASGLEPEGSKQTIKVTVTHTETGTEKTYAFNWTWAGKINLETAGVVVEIPEVTFNGTPATPAVVVKIGDKVLVEGTDYTLEYSENDKPGMGIATITGIGEYTGVVKAEFPIREAATDGQDRNDGNGSSGSSGGTSSGNTATVSSSSTDSGISKTEDTRGKQIALVFSAGAIAACIIALARRKRVS